MTLSNSPYNMDNGSEPLSVFSSRMERKSAAHYGLISWCQIALSDGSPPEYEHVTSSPSATGRT